MYTAEKRVFLKRNIPPPSCFETIPDEWTAKVNLELEKWFSDKSSSIRTTQGSSQDQYSRTRSHFIWIIQYLQKIMFLQNYIDAYVFFTNHGYLLYLFSNLFTISTYDCGSICEHLLFFYSIRQKQKKFGDLVIFFSRIFQIFQKSKFFVLLSFYKPSLESCEVLQKIWAQSVQPF